MLTLELLVVLNGIDDASFIAIPIGATLLG